MVLDLILMDLQMPEMDGFRSHNGDSGAEEESGNPCQSWL